MSSGSKSGNGIFLSAAGAGTIARSTDMVNVCAVVGSSSNFGLKNTLIGPTGLADVYIGASGSGGGHRFNLPNYAGGGLAAVQSFLAAANSLSGGAVYNVYADAPATPSMFTGNGTTCPTP